MQYVFIGYEYYNALIFTKQRKHQKQWHLHIRNENQGLNLQFLYATIAIDIIISYINLYFSSNKGMKIHIGIWYGVKVSRLNLYWSSKINIETW